MSRSVALVLCVLLALVASVGDAAAGELERLVEELGGKDAKARSQSYRSLIQKRDARALPMLRKAMPTWDRTGRYYGVLVLETYPYEEVRRTWKRLLGAEPAYLRFSAANAMLRRGDKDALPVLVAAIKDSTADVYERVWMVSRLPTDAPVEAIDALRSLLDARQAPTVISAVLRRMHVRRDQAAMIGATRLLSATSADVRALAASYLLRMGDLRRAGALVHALRAGVTQGTLDVVTTFLSSLPRVPMGVLDGVTRLLEAETQPWAQLRWIKFLRQFRHTKARKVLHDLVYAKHNGVARAAFDALTDLSGTLTGETLKPLLEEEDVDRRLWAADALRRRDDTSGLTVVIMALQEGSQTQRTQAARLLGSFRSEACVEPLLDAMEDDQPGVRGQALGSLQRVLAGLFPYRWLRLTSTGYAATAKADVRAEAIRAIRQWWEENRHADW